ncbi:transactivator protein [Whitefly-associated begomovirus 7]|uniref:Transcriptional activator protein n=1 Tax=Whitefly-associated begomovirus 7 TaxID=2169744 RepID=A0A0P0IL54_9GEMI|nr:transactivator protein [Whitefly-associated begomovirus 7]ALK03555.1 transactivator protein [Whitefly-associated begomovirus 7]ALK03561.1 transactivator protein [Whitefly-associated begomovirus 7]ALK03585.1 transactivator protein [Whitefly-associated begomovirus 7]ALK03609.1 transactivator protein [Whitefly-associated begomovirus 7]
MQPSSPSTSHYSPLAVKVLHRNAKKRALRRKRVDLDCGCSFYLHIGCTNHGFTHRGTHHCGSGKEWRFYLGDNKSPLFQDTTTRPEAVQLQQRHNNCPDQVQPQPEEGSGDSQVFSDLPNLDCLTASDWSFLKSI